MTKYLCDKCMKEQNLPVKFRRILHECDQCKEVKLCSDDKVIKPFGKKR